MPLRPSEIPHAFRASESARGAIFLLLVVRPLPAPTAPDVHALLAQLAELTHHEPPLREAPSTLEHEPQRRDRCEDDQESDRAEGKEKRILPDGRLLRGPPEREVSGTPRGLGHEGHEVGCRPGEVERL